MPDMHYEVEQLILDAKPPRCWAVAAERTEDGTRAPLRFTTLEEARSWLCEQALPCRIVQVEGDRREEMPGQDTTRARELLDTMERHLAQLNEWRRRILDWQDRC